MQELKKEAIETIKDIDEKLLNEKKSFTEKLASRYKEILEEIKEQIGYNEGSVFRAYSNEQLAEMVQSGKIGTSAQLEKELKMIREAMSKEELKLALKKEERSETEKITEEYQKQKDILENAKKLHEARRDGRFLTGADGKIKFFDENGNFLEALERDQEKEFEAEAKKLQEIADEELKIHTEKTEKLAELEMEFQKEREKLNKNYFNEDKEMRLKQNAMSEEYFRAEIARMAQIRAEAIDTANALRQVQALGGNTTNIVNNSYSNTTNNATNTQNVSVKSVADVRSIDRQLGTKLGLHNFRK